VHGWVAKQQVQVDVTQQISVIAALQEAESRVINGRVLSSTPAALTHAEPTALAYATTEPINATANL
jgi:hypothetical protein